MAIKVPGSMAGLQIGIEVEFGVPPMGGLIYGGHMRTLSTTFNPTPTELEPDNARTFSDMFFATEEHGFSTELSIYRDTEDYTWTDLIQLALGSIDGIDDELSSFSTVLKVARDQYFLAKGCVIDSLNLSTEGVGKQIRADVEVSCMRVDVPLSERPENIGTDAVKPSSPPLTYTKYPTCTLDGIGTINAKSWELSINNNLEPQEGFDPIDGKPLSAGSGLVPGIAEISLTMDVMSSGSLWDALKMELTEGFDVSFELDGWMLTIKDCYLPAGDMPSRSNTETYDETITVKGRDITLTRL